MNSRNLPCSDLTRRAACTAHNDIAKSTREEVENALDGVDKSDLRVSLRRAIGFSIPPLTLYHNYRPGVYSNLIFGVPLVDLGLNEDKVPKVMRMCIEEVEKRGINVDKIYSVRLLSRHVPIHAKVSQSAVSIRDPEVRKASGMCSADQSIS